MQSVTVTAAAKVNLYLHVTGQRADGYHLLESLVAFTEFGDRLMVSPGEGLSLTIGGPFADGLTDGPDNLILRAASELRDLCGVTLGAAIHLDKTIPVAAGIGGGSADAAAALTALCDFWDLNPDRTALDDLALGLGADVPVCLHGRPAHMAGIGEEVTSAPDLPDLGVLLVNPLQGVSTPQVFKALNGAFGPADRIPDAAFADPASFLAALHTRRNDLMAPAVNIAPVVGEMLAALEGLDGCRLARMSGSGATCFGLFDDPGHAARAADVFRTTHPGWWAQSTRFSGARPI
ncbi:4-(cytidine 5'-diphospho)-2-C-methyl-D-erythritol kinase [Aestuariispira ectoiniformans]|uniref:4-(cytidine 5'-diphospho)-2-C-methyl-D-erythritol kinase n=1 Tax=Aestuariispira ectoiniformans TaxID=2775080 RepID=UPI00223AC132|nr:4-(cytidine 5'-diphospho)-2-C-methyl-D-erythritol kinase [Aestuariispira ectoiniformans]